MRAFIIFLTSFFLLQGNINASVVDTSTAKIAGKNFIYEKLNLKGKADYSSIKLQYVKKEESNKQPVFYIYNIQNKKGFIIISAEDNTNPILAYSYENNFNEYEQKPPAYIEWMDSYKKQIDYIRKNKTPTQKSVNQLWMKYSSKPVLSSKSGQAKSISPLLTTNWNQGKYYNELCPSIASGGQDGHAWVGCVAVAIAQIMKYWNYPDYGSDSNTYYHWQYGNQTADFANTNYDWSSMPNSLSNYNTATATLLYHAGVSVYMDYGTSGSGASSSSAANALNRYFDYSHTLYLARKSYYDDTIWRDMIKSELDLGHPLYYSGGTHAFNCDGYEETDHFHFNWGWGGSYNGYFYLNDLSPGSYNFTSGQVAIINAYPDCQDPICNGTTVITDLYGTFTDGSSSSGSYSNYSNCSDCGYLLKPDNATAIHLQFESFSTIEGEDSLYIYDGPDDTSPLLLAISGDTIPNDIITSGGSAYLHFITNNYTTAAGWEINYTSSFNDVGVTSLSKPISKTCGSTTDSIEVQIKNFGINTQTNIPVVVNVVTPSGPLSFNANLPGPLAINEIDTLFVGLINTTLPGDYIFTSYTNLSGDTDINSNDTIYSNITTKTLLTIPHVEDFKIQHGEDGDWFNKNYVSHLDYDAVNDNYFMSGMVSQPMAMFLILDAKIGDLSSNTNLLFDYRFLDAGGANPPDSLVLNSDEKLHVIVSIDCGITYDTIYSVNSSNHINTSKFTTKEISLSDYAGEDIIIGFTSEWDMTMAIIDLDNVIFVDSINNNLISSDQSICKNNTPNTLTGTIPNGGIGEYNYRWETSADSSIWNSADGVNNLQNYSPDLLTTNTYFRRIVQDTDFYRDTSNTIRVTLKNSPSVNILGSTSECENTILDEGLGNSGDTYQWSTDETTQTITAFSSGEYSLTVTNSNDCTNSDTVDVTIFDLPIVNLGNDTSICEDVLILDAGVFNSYLWSNTTAEQDYTVSNTGEYSVKVTDMNGCVNSDTINITINTKPTVNILGSTSECENTILDEGLGNSGDTYQWSTGETTQTITTFSSGEYSLTVTNSNNCTNSDTVDVTIFDLPTVNLGNDTSICAENSIQLDAGNYSSYQWSTFENSQYIYIDSSETGFGTATIYVEVANSNSCTNSDTINITFNDCVGISKYEIETIKIYPNPTKNELFIVGKNILKIEIFNTKGQIVKQLIINNENINIDLSPYANGIYFISIFRDKGKITKMIVKE